MSSTGVKSHEKQGDQEEGTTDKFSIQVISEMRLWWWVMEGNRERREGRRARSGFVAVKKKIRVAKEWLLFFAIK